MKSNLWIFPIEPLETRYTGQWYRNIPDILRSSIGDTYNIIQVDGIQRSSAPTPGAFLNFIDTNYWKSSQLISFMDMESMFTPSDVFLITDAWNPIVLQLKYISELMGYDWTFHGMWHAGSYDPNDFLGREIGDADWVRCLERSLYNAYDYNHFATEYHIDLFTKTLGVQGQDKIARTGWFMEYMKAELAPFRHFSKRDLILFPHRLSTEKQVEIFRDLSKSIPEYDFVVCQEKELSKNQYHTLLGEAKIVFSANLQETLGISCYEGSLLNAIPMVPNRLSYTEMYADEFLYPSNWTESFNSYAENKESVVNCIRNYIRNYESLIPLVEKQASFLDAEFFSATNLINKLCVKN